ncbi:MAG: hypothetical protein HQ596_05065 [Candidatus Saganbacteria bacterium]|nr:hypothetical protein [Candidatus Saganbacteria bacterium]
MVPPTPPRGVRRAHILGPGPTGPRGKNSPPPTLKDLLHDIAAKRAKRSHKYAGYLPEQVTAYLTDRYVRQAQLFETLVANHGFRLLAPEGEVETATPLSVIFLTADGYVMCLSAPRPDGTFENARTSAYLSIGNTTKIGKEDQNTAFYAPVKVGGRSPIARTNTIFQGGKIICVAVAEVTPETTPFEICLGVILGLREQRLPKLEAPAVPTVRPPVQEMAATVAMPTLGDPGGVKSELDRALRPGRDLDTPLRKRPTHEKGGVFSIRKDFGLEPASKKRSSLAWRIITWLPRQIAKLFE